MANRPDPPAPPDRPDRHHEPGRRGIPDAWRGAMSFLEGFLRERAQLDHDDAVYPPSSIPDAYAASPTPSTQAGFIAAAEARADGQLYHLDHNPAYYWYRSAACPYPDQCWAGWAVALDALPRRQAVAIHVTCLDRDPVTGRHHTLMTAAGLLGFADGSTVAYHRDAALYALCRRLLTRNRRVYLAFRARRRGAALSESPDVL